MIRFGWITAALPICSQNVRVYTICTFRCLFCMHASYTVYNRLMICQVSSNQRPYFYQMMHAIYDSTLKMGTCKRPSHAHMNTQTRIYAYINVCGCVCVCSE